MATVQRTLYDEDYIYAHSPQNKLVLLELTDVQREIIQGRARRLRGYGNSASLAMQAAKAEYFASTTMKGASHTVIWPRAERPTLVKYQNYTNKTP